MRTRARAENHNHNQELQQSERPLEAVASGKAAVETQAETEKEIGNDYLRDLDSQLRLEEQLIEEFSKDRNQNWRETLLGLRKSGEETLRKLSAMAVETFNSNRLIVRLRDDYIRKRGAQINKELSVDNQLAQADDYDSFLRLVASDFWGTSSHQDEALLRVNSALTAIFNRFPEKTDDVLAVWPKLLSRSDSNGRTINGFTNCVHSITNGIEYGRESREQNLELYLQSDSDFIAARALQEKNLDNPETQKQALARIDSIISNFPRSKALPKQTRELFLNFFNKRPDELSGDSRRLDFVFQLFLNENQRTDREEERFINILPLIADRARSCSKEEGKELKDCLKGKLNRSRDFSYLWLLDLLPWKSQELKSLKKNGSRNSESLILKRAELSKRPLSEEEISLLEARLRDASSDDKIGFLSIMAARGFGENSLFGRGVADRLLSAMSSYKNNNNNFSSIQLHALSLMMKRSIWPEELKKKVFLQNNLSSRELNNIFSDDLEKYAWVKEEPLLLAQLETDYHRQAAANDLRHYFYEVLEGQKETNDLDGLIKAYGDSQRRLDLEEIRNLFFVRHIDIKYIGYFIDKLVVADIIYGLNNGGINSQEAAWLLEMSVRYGQVEDSAQAVEKVFQQEGFKTAEKRQEITAAWTDNIIKQLGRYYSGRSYSQGYNYKKTSTAAVQLFSPDSIIDDFLTAKEASAFRRNLLERAFDLENDGNLTVLSLSFPKSIIDNFPDKKEDGIPVNDREDYLHKLLNRLLDSIRSNPSDHLFVKRYFSDLGPALKDEDFRLKFEDRLLSTIALSQPNYFIEALPNMDENQRQRFLRYFEDNFSIAHNNGRSVDDLCSILFAANLALKKESKRVYIKMFNDPNLSSSQATTLFQEEIVFSDDDIRQAFFSNIDKWPQINGNNILEAAARRQEEGSKEIISQEEAKKISFFTLKNRGLSPGFWQGYQSSDPERPIFYLDDELFALGLENIGSDCSGQDSQTLIPFLESLRSSRFGLAESDLKKIIRLAIMNGGHTNYKNYWEDFLHYRPELTETVAIECCRSRIPEALMEVDFQYSAKFKEEIIEIIFENNFKPSAFENFLLYLKNNNSLDLVPRVKEYVSGLEKKKQEEARLILLRQDLLNVNEARELYNGAISDSSKNVREQILSSIDIIGSMLSNRDNIDQLELFFDKPRPEQVASLKEISDFIEAYRQENKGRSVAVMLFAREYLPGRDLGEVVERVANSLRKYREVIEKNTYNQIPDGLRASIGMEYEITNSTANGYQELTGQSSLKSDIARLSEAARIGAGRDAVHEIATRPTDNPYLMLLEMKLLHDIEYIDLNFDRSPDYQKGARGFHLTIGGERGLSVNQESSFLQNAIIAASWGGVQAGEIGHRVNGGRGVSLRNRAADDSNNIRFFKQPSSSVELRSLSIDKQETLQRAVTTAYNGAIAIQAFRECFSMNSSEISAAFKDGYDKSKDNRLDSKDPKTGELATLWIELVRRVEEAVKSHNESFLDRESYGYLDDRGVWVDAADFGGEYNRKRFQEIVGNIDPTLSLEEYVQSTRIRVDSLFQSFGLELSDKLTKINNLYLKPGARIVSEDGKGKQVFKGDHANALSMLETTKISNGQLEYLGGDFLDNTVFDTAGDKRQGYYSLQGGSELMLTHAVQRALLDFNAKMEALLR